MKKKQNKISNKRIVSKLGIEAKKRWKRLKGYNNIQLIVEGFKFIDGVLEKKAA